MKVANTVDLKNKTNELLREVRKGQAVIITYRGKPAASLVALTEEGLEDFVLEHSPRIKKMILEAEKDRKAGRLVSFNTYLEDLQCISISRGKIAPRLVWAAIW